MTDILIRDVPDEAIAALDAHAQRLGMSRSEYLRRLLAQDASRSAASCTREDLRRSAEVFRDLDAPEVMADAWDGHA
ncbi:ribbon-helix-helix protein, CopG family [Pseudonocardia sp.]|uniref:type II toxin-antitoxin system VapB family antitoxin n=1 Tax=Pseudonocardia sp. TaxID=60912 RepID=UPI00261ADF1A|nr:ribbon-helix-helix protein, CopG family [Pseudonocardia sp.]